MEPVAVLVEAYLVDLLAPFQQLFYFFGNFREIVIH